MRRSNFALALALLALSGCRGCNSSRPPVHLNPNMDIQPRYEPQAASAFFYNGQAMRPPVAGTVARGELQGSGPYWTGKDAGGAFVAAIPMAVSDAVRERGAERYDIYCAACHDKGGDGKGILFERGKVPTPSFHIDRLRQMPDGQIFDTITNGFGLMPPYRYPLPVADRWAIIVHLRGLQARRLERTGGAAPVETATTPSDTAPADAAPADAAPADAAPEETAPADAAPTDDAQQVTQ